jgi:hypothetical protein
VVESGQGPQPFVGGLLLQAAASSAGAGVPIHDDGRDGLQHEARGVHGDAIPLRGKSTGGL